MKQGGLTISEAYARLIDAASYLADLEKTRTVRGQLTIEREGVKLELRAVDQQTGNAQPFSVEKRIAWVTLETGRINLLIELIRHANTELHGDGGEG